MICAECGSETAEAVQVCAVCGAPPVGASRVIAGGEAAVNPADKTPSRHDARHGDNWLSFRSPWLYLLGSGLCLVLFIGGVVGINKAPPRSGLSYTMGWIVGLSLLGGVVSLVCFSSARIRIRREQAANGTRADDILKVLETRQLRPTWQQRELIVGSKDRVQLERWFDRSLVAITADEVFKD
jgi:hypothetical protein